MSLEGGAGKEQLKIVHTLEEVLRGLKILRPDSHLNYKVKERRFGNIIGVQIKIGESSIISEREDGSYEIFPKVNGETIQDLFGYYPDEVCRYLNLEQAVKIAEAAEEAKRDPNKLLALKKSIDDCYPDGFPESPIGMVTMIAQAEQHNKPELIKKVYKQFERHIIKPGRKKKSAEDDEI